MKRYLILWALLGALTISATTQSTNIYEVRVSVRTGNCSQTRYYTVEARSQAEAKRKATSAALNSTRVIINGVSQKR